MKTLKSKLLMLTLLVVGVIAMSFTLVNKSDVKSETKQENLKWFQVNANRNPNQTVTQAQATYLGEGTTPPAGTGCDGSNFQCVSGFTEDQVNSSNEIIGAQLPSMVAHLKN